LIDPQRSLVSPLGVFLLDLNPEIANALPGLRSLSGLVVAAVVDYEPVLYADLVMGDVIRSIGGKALASVGDLRAELARFKPDPVVLEVERQGVFQFVTFERE
jgi:S1-C subfamily serine protease